MRLRLECEAYNIENLLTLTRQKYSICVPSLEEIDAMLLVSTGHILLTLRFSSEKINK